MRKIITILSAMALMLGLFATSAIGHHRSPAIQFNDAALGSDLTVSVGTPVTVTSVAYQDTDRKEHSLQRCVLDGTHVASSVCDVDRTGSWATLVSSTGSNGHAATTYDAPTSSAGVFGYRVISGDHDTDTADLTVQSTSTSQRHNACNGIENAYAKSNGKGKEKLAEHAEKFGCDIEE
jgi:hypothetical protein